MDPLRLGSLIIGVIASIATPSLTQQLDTLEVYPSSITLGLAETSAVPIVAIVRYDDGFTFDVTDEVLVSVANESVVEPVNIVHESGGDTLSYWYLRGRSPGVTSVSVSTQGLDTEISAAVVSDPPEPPLPLSRTAMEIGTNLIDLSDISPDLVFTDVFMVSRPWVSSTLDGWDDHPGPVTVDSLGWVESLLPDQVADTILLLELDGGYPMGSYTLTWEGTGSLILERGWTGLPYSTIPYPDLGDVHVAEVTIGPSDDGGVRLRIVATDPGDPIRSIRLWMPEAVSGVNPTNADTPPEDPFLESFVAQVSRYCTLRFGNWFRAMDGTDNQSETWGDATTIHHATQARSWGIAPEWPLRLLNRINASGRGCEARTDGWFVIPYRADDGYVRRFAELVATTVDFAANPETRVYVEWANEVWNPSFVHLGYAAELGIELGLDWGTGDPWIAATGYQVYRSRQIFEIFEDVFARTHPVPGGVDRLRRVLAGASAWPYINHVLLDHPGAADEIDLFAVAPYVGVEIGGAVNELPPSSLPTVDELLAALDDPSDPDNLESSDVEQRIRDMAQVKALVDSWSAASGNDIEMGAYEFGQHLAGWGYWIEPHVYPLFEAANHDPRMGDIYRRLLLGWREVGGSTANHFLHRDKWWQWGLFGALEWYDEDETTLPVRHKYVALLEALEVTGSALPPRAVVHPR